MEEIQDLIYSPTFWFASVVIAFLMSFFAAFAKDWAERTWAKFSNRRSTIIQSREQELTEMAELLKNDTQLMFTYQNNIVFQKLRQILYYVVSYFFIGMAAHNYLNGSESGAIAFALIAFIVMALPIQLVTRDLNRLRKIVNRAIDSNEKHFFG